MSFTSKTRWRQFSLRGLLVLVTVSAALFGWFAWRLQKARVENEAAEAIVHAGGEVAYADQFHGGVSRLTPLPPRTRWIGGLLERTFGADPHRRLVSVKLYDDDSVALVSQYALRDLEVVRLDGGTSITDEALPHLRGCNQLRVLYLERSDITDRALEHIDEFTRLEELWLCNTRVSDAVLEKIARLPRLSVLDIRGTNISDDGLKMVAS